MIAQNSSMAYAEGDAPTWYPEGDFEFPPRSNPSLSNPINNLGAVKHNEGKVPYRHFPISMLEPVAKVFAFGANKYATGNWKGLHPLDLWDAAQRHLVEFDKRIHGAIDCGDISENGDFPMGFLDSTNDAESNLSHIDHAIVSLMMMRHVIANGRIDVTKISNLNNKGADDDRREKRFKESPST